MALPETLPILSARLEREGLARVYHERELTEPVDLCDAHGRLNPAAVGWSRKPLVRANLTRHLLRRKRWSFWSFIAPDFVLSATVADLDYLAFCEVSFTDFRTRQTVSVMEPRLPGSIEMSEYVERSIEVRGRTIDYRKLHEGDALRVSLRADAKAAPIRADLAVAKPPGHESLNIVVPWTPTRFQFNSKHCALPTSGSVRVGEQTYWARPDQCHAVQDFGRGVWPHHSFWNWAVATGVQEGTSIGVNMGGKWTTGTGSNENGIFLDGRLHKVMEDLDWSYDPADWLAPWRVVAPHSRALDLTLEPIVVRTPSVGFGPLSSRGACAFGRWRGTLHVAGRELTIHALPGWAEEFEHRW